VSSAWNKADFRKGWENSIELAAEEVACPAIPADLKGTYFRNNLSRVVGWGGVSVRHPFDADGMVCI
jgi:carotenoid cleavage dioxygenase-like enzyme